jgi:FkbM family methyltransferase
MPSSTPSSRFLTTWWCSDKNTACNPKIHIHAYGLSDKDGTFPLYIPTDDKTNMGMLSLHSRCKEGRHINAPIRAVPHVLQKLSLESIDIIKIDTEGSEFEILKAFPPEVLANVKWIYGELHRQGLEQKRDFAVLDYLSNWFSIAVDKPLHKENYSFDACNRQIADRFPRFRRSRSYARY